MVLDLALLGTGGMMPLPHRWLSSVLVRYGRHLILFDCGEATQLSLRAVGWGIKDIDLILISHVHGDHVLGLPGLLLTLGNSGRTEPVDVLGPPGLSEVVRGLMVVAPQLPFAVRVHEVDSPEGSACVFELDGLAVSSAAGDHRVACRAYRLDVLRARRFRPEAARALGVPVEDWRRLQRGETVDGVTPDAVLGPPRRGVAVGLITDTRPTAGLQALVRGVDVLFCEGTYGNDDDQPRAVERKHMTFREAATLAREAGVGRLVLTHFSPLVVEPSAYAETAQSVFAESVVGHDGLTLSVAFPADD
jgi:ribonuclease Z